MKLWPTLKLKKCYFFNETIDYLGHVIRPGSFEISIHTKDGICGFLEKINIMDPRTFSYQNNVFVWFYSNFAQLEDPLSKKIQKDHSTKFPPLNEKELGV